MALDSVNKRLSYHVANLQNVGARARQEDSFAFANAFDVKAMRDEGLLFVVCDGMGGMKDGKVASEAAINVLRNSFFRMNRNADINSQIESAIYEATAEVERLLDGQGGSTAVVCVIYQDELYYASVGDSFLYLKRGNSLVRINAEHNVCNREDIISIREGNFDPNIGKSDPEANALTQFLGMTGMDEVDRFYRPLHLRKDDVLLACSDGVGGVLTEEEVFNCLSADNPDIMVDIINNGIIAHAKRNQDNYTALVVKCVM